MAMLDKAPSMPDYPHHYRTIVEENQTRRMLQMAIDTEICRDISAEGLENQITHYYYHQCNGAIAADLDPTDFAKIRKVHHSLATEVGEADIAPVREKSEPGLCWHRLAEDLSDGPTPTFDEMMGRMTNQRAVMAWIGSLLYQKADTQQYLWIYGAGANGKGSLFKQLAYVLGPGYGSEQVPDQGSRRFWPQGLLGKRLIVFPDCNDYKFPTTGLFKSITGGDPVRVEIKNGSIFSATLNAKVAFLSNEDPAISGSMADRRRAIYSEIGPIAGEIMSARRYDGLLRKEIYHFLWKCKELYKEVCPDHGPIPCDDNAALEEIIATTEESHQNVMEEFFELGDGFEVRCVTLQKVLMQHDNYRRGPAQGEFTRWLKRRHDIRKARAGKGGPRIYRGIRVRPGVGSEF